MATKRKLAIYIIVIAAFAVTHTLLLMAWIGNLEPAGPMRTTDIAITDVQFGKDYLNVAVKNYCYQTKTVSEVMVYRSLNPRPAPEDELILAHELVHEPISVGEQISIRINFDWISGYTYRIELETADPEDFHLSYSATAP